MSMKTVAVRNLIFGEGTPKICIPVTAKTTEEIKLQTARILSGPCDLIEWRIDFFEETQDEGWLLRVLQTLRDAVGDLPLLATFRTKEEGGERCISLEEYKKICLDCAKSGMADLVDVEINRGEELLKDLSEKIREAGAKTIASFHDFSKTPAKEELIRILTAMQSCGADITKAAVMPITDRDVLELLEASLCMKETFADRPFITMSMSRKGAVSRLAGGLTGSCLTFATAGKASAPGQMEAQTLAKLLPFLY